MSSIDQKMVTHGIWGEMRSLQWETRTWLSKGILQRDVLHRSVPLKNLIVMYLNFAYAVTSSSLNVLLSLHCQVNLPDIRRALVRR